MKFPISWRVDQSDGQMITFRKDEKYKEHTHNLEGYIRSTRL